MRIINTLLVLLTISTISCVSTYHHSISQGSTTSSLVRNTNILLAVPDDAYFGTRTYTNSGKMTTTAVKNALSHYTYSITVDQTVKDFGDIPNTAFSKYDYVVMPTIVKWIDYATEWSFKRDVLEIKIIIIDCSTRSIYQSAVIKGRTKFVSFGGDHPQDLLDPSIEDYFQSVFM